VNAALAVLRPTLAGVLALFLTGALFWFLAALIDVDVDAGAAREATRIEFTRMRRDTEVQSRREEYEKPTREPPPVVPTTPRMALSKADAARTSPVQMLTPTITSADIKLDISGGGSDRDIMPLVRVNPEYPRRALQRGIEGWVQLQFTISAAGTTKNIRIVDAEPKGVFDDAALQAVARWRYNPRVENGVAVERVGVRILLRFKLDE
jgi:periplasmic protein TonB